ncbi:hypothetical protein J4Q44_G00103560 [Coregonus suidteri]|uniref:Ig-like domain-containing protein n=1 Tax=Coregonus suidteri TaxID=861788 RepID=A0AAN8QWD7_9TELE
MSMLIAFYICLTLFLSIFSGTDGYFESEEAWNKDASLLAQVLGELERFCKHNAAIHYSAILDKTAEPHVRLSSVTPPSGRHPAMLMCSAYDFYPKPIRVTWLRDGQEVKSDVTSTEELANGDWYYQIHSNLEYTPKSGEKISCMVEHISLTEPMIYHWDPSLPESERNKIAIEEVFWGALEASLEGTLLYLLQKWIQNAIFLLVMNQCS